MSALGKLKTILRSACNNVAQDIYEGTATTYLVYNVAAENPTDYHDDGPTDNTIYLQVHLYIPKDDNYISLQNQLRAALFQGGFSYPHVSLNTVESDTKLRHICYETNIAESEV